MSKDSHAFNCGSVFRPPIDYLRISTCKPSKEVPKHPYRSAFMLDRDNILYHKSLLRLAGKTQIATHGKNDHLRNRLTHTLEVSQIARTVAEILGLDVNLAEAIALGHDIGHTPFGHVGERTLHMLTNGCFDAIPPYFKILSDGYHGFKHNLNSARILIELKNKAFSNYTLFGIKHHTSAQYTCDSICKGYAKNNQCITPTASRSNCPNEGKTSLDYYKKYEIYWSYDLNGKSHAAWSLEAFVVQWADEVAQRHHDIEDAVRMNLVDIKKLSLLDEIKNMYDYIYKHTDFFENYAPKEALNYLKEKMEPLRSESQDVTLDIFSSFIVEAYVTFIIALFNYQIKKLQERFPCNTSEDFSKAYPSITLDDIEKQFDRKKIKEALEKEKTLTAEEQNILDFLVLDDKIQKKLSSYILLSYNIQSLDGKGGYIIRCLAKAYLTNPQQLPDNVITEVCNLLKPDISIDTSDVSECRGVLKDFRAGGMDKMRMHLLRSICHYIANMTDRLAIEEYQKLYG